MDMQEMIDIHRAAEEATKQREAADRKKREAKDDLFAAENLYYRTLDEEERAWMRLVDTLRLPARFHVERKA